MIHIDIDKGLCVSRNRISEIFQLNPDMNTLESCCDRETEYEISTK